MLAETFPSSQRRGGCAERSDGADGVVRPAETFAELVIAFRFDQQCHAKQSCTAIWSRKMSIKRLEGYLGGTAPLAHGKRKIECGASTRLGFRPDAATVAVDNAAHCC